VILSAGSSTLTKSTSKVPSYRMAGDPREDFRPVSTILASTTRGETAMPASTKCGRTTAVTMSWDTAL